MKRITLLLASAWLLLPVSGMAQETLEDLLREVEAAASQEARVDQERLQQFRSERNRQQQLLEEARAELRAQQQRSDRLNADFDENERELADLETTLAERQGNLGELFGVVRQVAGDFASTLDDSMTSAQYPGRSQFLSDLAQRDRLPRVDELREMWMSILREIVASGQTVEFTADVTNADGDLETGRTVARLGVFNAVSDGNFLRWDSVRERLVELPRQPASRFQSMAASFQQASPGTVEEMAVDFTRGTILQSVVQSPTYRERLRQGGPVGMVIVALGVIGLLFAIWKGVMLFIRGNAIKRQTKRSSADKGNALGRVLAVYEDNPDADVETLELKLDEAILRETAPLESGLPFIKVLYVVAPLIGLLGTVVGMIQTFQQITLFGTGDPRMMAGGISMALITTVLGLVVAIPLTLIHSVLQSRSRQLVQILEEQAAGIIARTAEERHGHSV